MNPLNTPAIFPAAPRSLLRTADAWRIVENDPFDSHGKVEFLPGDEPGTLFLKLAAGSPGTGVSYRGPVPRIDYRIEAEARRSGGEDFFYGLTFPIHDQHASLIIGGWSGGVTGISNLDGNSAVENATTGYQPFETGRWYSIGLEVSHKRIAATIDGKPILEIRTGDYQYSVWPQQQSMIPLGIATWKTSAEIRRLSLATH